MIWTNADPIHWRIYAALVVGALKETCHSVENRITSQALNSASKINHWVTGIVCVPTVQFSSNLIMAQVTVSVGKYFPTRLESLFHYILYIIVTQGLSPNHHIIWYRPTFLLWPLIFMILSFQIDADTGESVTFTELIRQIRCVGSALRRRGVRPGDVILVFSPNSLVYPVIIYAANYIGAVITTCNPLYTVGRCKCMAN